MHAYKHCDITIILSFAVDERIPHKVRRNNRRRKLVGFYRILTVNSSAAAGKPINIPLKQTIKTQLKLQQVVYPDE